ncbi:MAG: low specificity L-threonine aldolase [Hyphomonadaceae bacterium]|nr:low specificity L-threonine aldolase [Hyphomonadaceae bacterium]
MNFRSDNTAGAHPAILEALAKANEGHALSYGDDDWTRRLEGAFRDLFGQKVAVFLTATGTAANAISLAAMAPPWGAIFCHREAHVETDEAGAPEFFSGGAKLVLIDGAHAKITPEGLEEALTRNLRGVHSVKAAALTLTQCTERGASYTAEEIARLADVAHRENIGVHVDGARFANAVAYLGATPRSLTIDAGVDVMSFGATKNGALAAEAILVFEPKRVDEIARRRKRGGHLLSKHRFVAAQMLAYLENGLWLHNAARANGLAQRIAQAAGDWVSAPAESNHVFLKAGVDALAKLRAAGAEFYDWGAPGSGEARLVVAWNQSEADVDSFCALVRALRSQG